MSVGLTKGCGPLVVIETIRQSVSQADDDPFKFKLVGILRAHQAGMVWRENTDWINTTLTLNLNIV